MYVKNRMSVRPYTVTPETSIPDAFEILKEHHIKRLPVVSGGKLVGIVTERDLQQVSPSKATTLSVFELNYLLSKAKVADAMTKNAITIDADALLEEAAVLMRENSISALPVMSGDEMVGIITETDIFDAFIEMMGFRDSGARITVQAEDIPGTLSDVCNIISGFGINISHVAVYGSNTSVADIVIRVNSKNTKEIEESLEAKGYKIV